MQKKLFVLIINFILIVIMVACGSAPARTIVFFTPIPVVETPVTGTPKLVYYSQRDPLWGDTVLTCGNGRSSTFLHQGCGETSFAMLMSTFVDPKYTPSTVLADFYGYGYCAGTDVIDSIELLRKNGFTALGVYRSIDSLKEYISQGWLAWAHVVYGRVAHEVIFTGVDENNNLIVADPFYGIGSIDSSQFPYSETGIVGYYIIKPPSK